jgi:3-isopropylmalate/(R)-2-methylmalate dehydratase small subunit
MNFEKINIIKSKAVITTIENIDTDQIIPARLLKTTTREGFGDNMFYDWRYNTWNYTRSYRNSFNYWVYF